MGKIDQSWLYMSMAEPGFPTRRGANLFTWQKFLPKTAWKWKKLEGDAHV